MAFRVRSSPQAKQDAREILNWLKAEDAGETGLLWFQGLRASVRSLRSMPQRCPLAPENDAVPFELRQLLYGSKRHRYRVLFTIEGEIVWVLRIRRPGQARLTSH